MADFGRVSLFMTWELRKLIFGRRLCMVRQPGWWVLNC